MPLANTFAPSDDTSTGWGKAEIYSDKEYSQTPYCPLQILGKRNQSIEYPKTFIIRNQKKQKKRKN